MQPRTQASRPSCRRAVPSKRTSFSSVLRLAAGCTGLDQSPRLQLATEVAAAPCRVWYEAHGVIPELA